MSRASLAASIALEFIPMIVAARLESYLSRYPPFLICYDGVSLFTSLADVAARTGISVNQSGALAFGTLGRSGTTLGTVAK